MVYRASPTPSATKVIFGEFRVCCDSDLWETTMNWWFATADELYHREGFTPEHWHFKPSPLGPSNDPDDYATGVVRETDAETLVRFGNALMRYAKKLKAESGRGARRC